MARRDEPASVDIGALVGGAPAANRDESAVHVTGDGGGLLAPAASGTAPGAHREKARSRRWWISTAAIACVALAAAAITLTRQPAAVTGTLGTITHEPDVTWTLPADQLVQIAGADRQVAWGQAQAVEDGLGLVTFIHARQAPDEDEVSYTLLGTDDAGASGTQPWTSDRMLATLIDSTGQVLWSRETGFDAITPLMASGGLVELPGRDAPSQLVIRSGTTGKVRATVDFGDGAIASAGARGNAAYVLVALPGQQCTLHRVDLADGRQTQLGEPIEKCTYSEFDYVGMSVGTTIGVIPGVSWVFDLVTGEILWEPLSQWPDLLQGDYVGDTSWSSQPDQSVFEANGRTVAQGACVSAAVALAAHRGESDMVVFSGCEQGEVTQVYRARSGELAWQSGERVVGVVGQHIVAVGLAGDSDGHIDGQLIGLAADTGAVQWRVPTSGIADLVGHDGKTALIYQRNGTELLADGELVAIDTTDGHTIWSRPAPKEAWPMPIGDQAAIAWVGPEAIERWDM